MFGSGNLPILVISVTAVVVILKCCHSLAKWGMAVMQQGGGKDAQNDVSVTIKSMACPAVILCWSYNCVTTICSDPCTAFGPNWTINVDSTDTFLCRTLTKLWLCCISFMKFCKGSHYQISWKSTNGLVAVYSMFIHVARTECINFGSSNRIEFRENVTTTDVCVQPFTF
jgi:hypothetical protein